MFPSVIGPNSAWDRSVVGGGALAFLLALFPEMKWTRGGCLFTLLWGCTFTDYNIWIPGTNCWQQGLKEEQQQAGILSLCLERTPAESFLSATNCYLWGWTDMRQLLSHISIVPGLSSPSEIIFYILFSFHCCKQLWELNFWLESRIQM